MSAEGYIRAARPQIITFYVLVVLLVGAMAGFRDVPLLGLTLLGVVLYAVSLHLRDEWIDYALGRDSEVGGMGTIRCGLATVEGLRRGSLVFLVLAMLVGLSLAYLAGWPVLGFALIGFVLYRYVHVLEMLPILHEWSVNIGIITAFLGVYYIQTLTVTLEVVLVSLIYSFWFTLGVAAQDFPDLKADKKIGKKTLWVLLGPEKASGVLLFHAVIATVLMILFFVVF